VGIQSNLARQQMRTLTHSCQGDGMGTVTCCLQARHDTTPAPGTMPGAVHQYENGIVHGNRLLFKARRADGTLCLALLKVAKQSGACTNHLKSK
jgi:hypothetical protein